MEPLKNPQEPVLSSAPEKKKEVSLPLDVKEHIFSYLEDDDLANTIQVSPSFKAITLELSKNELKLIESYVSWLLQKLDHGSEGKNELMKAMEGTKIFDDSIKLAEIKSSTMGLIKTILTIMKGFDSEKIHNLELLAQKENTPPHFGKFFKLVNIEKEIERATIILEKNEMLSYTEYQNILSKVCSQLIDLGQFDQAFEIAYKISSNRAIEGVIRSLVSNNNLGKASELINKTMKTFPNTSENFNKNSFILEMIKIFKTNMQFDKSFEMLELLLQTKYISKPLAKKEFDIIISRPPLSDLINTGLKFIQTEPDFISKYPAFARVVKSILIIDPKNKIKNSIPEAALDAIIIKENETLNRDKPLRSNL